jgi:glycosyltransferase 2 family protein
MSDHEHHLKSPKIRFWRYLPILIILGLAAHLFVPQITTLESSWSVVQGMTWWVVGLAIIAQALSYLGCGFMLHAILDINQQTLSTFKGVLITMASASIGLVAGGWVGAAAATYGWINRESHDGDTATLAGTLPALLNNAVLAGVAVIGTTYLLVVHDLSHAQLIGFGVILLVICLMIFSIVTTLRSPEPFTRLAIRLAIRWAALRHKPYESEETIASVRQFIVAWNSLGDGKWRRPALGAIANIGFDMLTLYFLFLATGYNVSLGVLFAGYGLPFILGKMAFLFPGGIGVMEASMVALYDSLQVPNGVSVVVILGYRLFSFWLPSLLGFAAAAYLRRKAFHSVREQA